MQPSKVQIYPRKGALSQTDLDISEKVTEADLDSKCNNYCGFPTDVE